MVNPASGAGGKMHGRDEGKTINVESGGTGTPRVWRLIDTDAAPGPYTAALDEAIARAVSEGDAPCTLHFYRRRPPAVTIGYSVDATAEIDIGYCRKNGIDIVRRLSGGGAIYTDDRQLVYSLATRNILPTPVVESLGMVCAGVVAGLKHLGVGATFAPVNDVLVNKKKVSGSAQLRKRGVVLQHGTVLVDADFKTMFGALRVPRHKVELHGLDAPENRVTTLRDEMRRLPSMDEVKSALRKGFEEVFNTVFCSGRPTDRELTMAGELSRSRYGLDEWNLKRPGNNP